MKPILLSYTQAKASSECAKKGLAQWDRRETPPVGDHAERIVVGHTVDRVVARAYDERWFASPPEAAHIRRQVAEDLEWSLLHAMTECTLTVERRRALLARMEPLTTVVEQMREFELIPTRDMRVQPYLRRPWADGVTLSGVLDLLLDDAGYISVVDVKAGSYWSSDQLAFYLWLLEGHGILPARVGFWFPLRREVSWKAQRRLPDIRPMVESAVSRLHTRDATTTPGPHCGLCPQRHGCADGLARLSRLTVVNARFAGLPSGVSQVGF